MRVALLSYNAPAGDAIGNQVAEKLAFFLDRGADVRVLVQSDQRLHPAVRPHCRVLPTPEPKGDGWRFLASADLVIVEYGQHYSLLQLLALLGGGKGRVLFVYHGVTPPEFWPAHNREAIEAGVRQRGLVWCADAALAHSRFTCRELQEASNFPPERVFCLGHPIDRNRFTPGRPTRPLAEALGLADVSLLLYVGRVAPNKRLPVLVEALAQLRDVTPAIHAVVIGDSGDLYQAEARRCRNLAAERAVADRFHWLGRVDDDRLRDAYRSADLFVMPSRHEGFCIPVVEAMACGLPVLAARATALPETVAGAGLTFAPDDANDLARQVQRILDPRSSILHPRSSILDPPSSILHPPSSIRVAVVAFRYGADFAGGAEASLRTLAEALRQDGHPVEVFTTCTRAENHWSNQLAEGTVTVGDIPVHRYRLDPHDRSRHLEAVRVILQTEGPVAPRAESEYLQHSIHSGRLLEALQRRQDDFDVIITGPYLFGLTLDVARAFPDRTLLLPCFHDEPLARLSAWRAYERVGGILYHSAEEQALAESRLGLNHPGAVCLGAVVNVESAGDPAAAPGHARTGQRNLLYCGRFSAQKGLPELLAYAQRYDDLRPGRFSFVFLGQGEVPIPAHPCLKNLGFVTETVKRDLLAGAAALVQLSRYESLSYAALEAWAQGTPVIADARCEVLAGHLRRCGGGRAVGSFDEFAQALDHLWEDPEHWQTLGRQGRDYVRTTYGSRQALTDTLRQAIHGLATPLAERMRARGLQRAAAFDRARWREQFADLVEQLLDAGPRPYREQVDIQPRTTARTVTAGVAAVTVPVRVVNRGTHALLADGPGRVVLRGRVIDEAGNSWGEEAPDTSLPALLPPGRALAAAVTVPVPARPGVYQVGFRTERAHEERGAKNPQQGPETDEAPPPESWLKLIVEGDQGGGLESPGNQRSSLLRPLLDTVQSALAEAGRLQQLPDDYTDVTEGLLAAWKRRLKRKLLGNFKHAYVDVLSRQQSAFNRFLLTALAELAECCATLDHAGQQGAVHGPRSTAADQAAGIEELAKELAESRQRIALLEERLARLEAEQVASSS